MPSDESGQPNPLAGRLYVKPKAPNTGFKVPGPTSGSPRAGRASGVLKPRADVGRSRTLEPLAKKAKPSIFMEQGRGEDYMREKTPPLPAKQLPSIGTDASKGVALRGSHDEPFPMDAAHHGVPASPDNWEPPSDGTAYIGLAYALRQYPNSTEFVYLRRLDKDSTSYNPYALDVVPFAAVDPNDFYTMSVRGVTHYVNGGSADFTNLDQWEREYQLFNAMCTLNVFKRYRAWKGFSLWRKAVRRGKIGRVQKLLKKNLFLLNDVFQTSLLCTRSLCFNLSQVRLHRVSSTTTYTLPDFCGAQDDQRAMVKQELQTFSEETVETVSTACTRALELLEERLNGFYTKENEGDPTATMMHSPRSSSITASVPGKAGGKDANNYSYTIAAARRSEQRKLLCFVKLADYMICDTLHNLLIDSVSDILTVTAPPPEPEVVMDEEAAAAEAEAAAAKAEEEAKKKAEGKPEAKTDKEKEEEEKNKPPEKVPLYEIEVLLADGQLVFAPSPDEFQEKMDEVVGGFVDTLCTVTRLLAQENLMSQVVEQGTEVEMGSTLAELIEDEVHQNLVGEVKYSLAVAFDAAEECKQTFLPHQLICAENDKRDAAVLKSEYSAGERTLESFREDIKEFKKQTTDIEELPLNTDEGIVRINSQQLKETFLPSPKMCLDQIFKILPELGAERYGTFISEVHEGSTRLNATINTVEDFVEQLVALEELKEKQKKFNDQLLEITNLYEVIDEFTIPVSEMDYAAYQTLNTDFSALKTSMEEVEMQKDDYVSRFSQELEAQVEVINKEAVAIRTAAQHEMILDEKSDGDVVVAYVTDLREKLKVQETGAKRIQKYQKLFKVMESKYDELDETVGDVDLKEMLWQGKREWADLTEEWGEMKFEDIDITNMEEKVGRFYKQVMKAERGLPSNKVVPEQKDKVEEFKGTIPVIASLRNKNLKERHWDKVEEIIGRPIVRDGNFTLNSLMALKVMDFAEEIGIVSTEATQEGVLEELLAKVQAKWADVEFSVLSYKESKDVFILGGVDEVMVTLEDSMVTMATILSSRYVAGIRTEVEKMEKALNLFSETLDEWLAVQKGWMYLESIFSAPDIQRQLPAEAKAFFQVDKQLKDIMRRVKDRPSALQTGTTPGWLEIFQKSGETLDKIQKNLEDYLETKRMSFPRFYFLSNDELLEILAQTKNVQAVQPHMSKCFDGIRLLDFGDDPKSIDIFAMISGEQEYVSLGKNLKARGNVEQWLSAVEAAMQASLKKFAKSAFQDYTKVPRSEWVLQQPAQLVLVISQVFWCQAVVDCLEGDNLAHDMADFFDQNVAQLKELTALVRGDLTKLHRKILCALITIDVHARDIIESLIADEVRKLTDFGWQMQLRYTWDDDNDLAVVRQTNASFNYAYEYLGAQSRLVVTPMTDRCYMTLTGALHLKLGGAPAGPAGTGKTETTKDLGKALGVQCVVFNCGDNLDFKFMGKFFSGLSQSGAWACFDEFNRIDIEVLSVVAQQLLSIQNALKAGVSTFFFEGREIKLIPTCGVFITMNPGYAGRTELPDNLKVLFRPMAMMIPDYGLVAEVMLFSEGFEDAKTLSRKMVKLYKLSSEQLSQQDHYDFGMRAVKSVLVMAGALKRANPDVDENVTLIRAMQDSNLPKFLADDVFLFRSIIGDLFPGVVIPPNDYGALQQSVEKCILEVGLQALPAFVLKVIQFFETINVRFGCMLVGPTGSGKTENYRMLQAALTDLRNEKNEDQRFQITHTFVLNPKCIKMGELYGEYNLMTNEWTDGLGSTLIRQAVADTLPDLKWVMFDGPVDAIWIENMNTVLDDNCTLCLPNGERIKLNPTTMRALFEVQDLSVASPATVSRCGMVYMPPTDLGWRPYVQTWVQKRIRENLNATQETKDYVYGLFEEYIDEGIKFLRRNTREAIPSVDINLVTSTTFLFEALVQEKRGINFSKPPEELHPQLGKLFTFAYMWGMGGNMLSAGWDYWDEFVRDLFPKLVMFPGGGTVFDYYIDMKSETFDCKEWSTVVPDFVYDSKTPYFEMLVPTMDTVRYAFLLEILLEVQKSALFTGDTGVGKSVIVASSLSNLTEPAGLVPVTINFSAQTNAIDTQLLIESKLEKKRKTRFGAPYGKKIVIFVDDVNMPARETYGAQPPIELLRQFQDFRGFYDRKKLFWKDIEDMTIVSACAPPGGGRQELTPRFVRHFNMFCVPPPSEQCTKTILSSILGGFLGDGFSKEFATLLKPIVDSSMEVFTRIAQELLPTPAKSHYTFNLRDLSKVFQGVLMVNPGSCNDKSVMMRLWVHEASRVFHDRLIDMDDKRYFLNMLVELLSKNFDGSYTYEEMFEEREIVFGDFIKIGLEREERKYEEVPDFEKMTKVMDDYLEEYNLSSTSPMNLVFFVDAAKHAARLARILAQPRGNAMLVGVGGSGKQSSTRFAAYMAGMKCFSIELTRGYGSNEFREDLKNLYKTGGIDGEPVVFLFTDTQIVNEGFVEDINNLLNSGEVPGLFPDDEKNRLMADLRPYIQSLGLPETKDVMWRTFINRVRDNLHIVLCMSPVGEAFRARCRQFPSLINCCTIDWFNEWPEAALQSVAKHFLAGVDLGDDDVKQSVCDMCVTIHTSVAAMAERFFNELRRRYYTTPKSYLDLINLYITLLDEKKTEFGVARDRLLNGLNKLEETNVLVDTMKVDLAELQPILKEKSEATAALLIQVNKDKAESQIVQERVGADEAEVKRQAAETKAIADDAKADLDEALPALEAAVSSLNSLSKQDITEVKSFPKPPPLVQLTMEAVNTLLQEKPDWDSAKKVLSDGQFLRRLFDFDKDNIPEKVIKSLKKYVDNPIYTPDQVAKQSNAAKSLCMWSRAMDVYHRVAKVVEPKRQALREAEGVLADANKVLKGKQDELAAVIARVQELENQLKQAEENQQSLAEQADTTAKRLQRAGKLTSALADEQVRWKETAESIGVATKLLVGDVFLGSGCISYYGAFTGVYRDELVTMWVSRCKEVGIPVSEECTLRATLSNPVEVREWNIWGLPTDGVSIDNGILTTRGKRWPLMIDPQGQANSWVKAMESKNGLRIVKLTDGNFLRTLENCIRVGYPVLIEDIGEQVDPSLEPVLLKQVFRQGNRLLIRLGDSDVDYDVNFKFYITTKLPNPHYLPEVCIKVTIINFTVTRKGLEDQLLGDVVRFERPDLEEQKDRLVVSIANDKKQLKDLEDKILKLLKESEGNILDDEVLINTLNNSKVTSGMIQGRVKEAEVTEKEINSTREQYRPVASIGSIIYFVIADLSLVGPMYQFSLVYFQKLFNHCLEAADASDDLSERLKILEVYTMDFMYTMVCRGLFEEHKLLFSFLLCSAWLRDSDFIKFTEWNFLLRGAPAVMPDGGPSNPAPDRFNEQKWKEIIHLSENVAAFGNLVKSMTSDIDSWLDWIDNSEPHAHRPPEVLIDPKAEGEEPGQLNEFHHLMLVKVFREEKVTMAASMYVGAKLGKEFVESKPWSLTEVFADTSSNTPVIFILSTGADPTGMLQRFAAEKGWVAGERLQIVSLGQGQGPIAKMLIEKAVKTGDWVCLQNCHLAKSWMLELESIVEGLGNGSVEVHEDFRLWLSSMPALTFPVLVLQNGIKLTNEPPKGLKANIKRTFFDMNEEYYAGCSKVGTWKKLLFSLAFFHGIIQERRKFGPLGWNIRYEFNNSDIECSMMTLHMFLEEQEVIPWEALSYVIGQINYGGRVTDDLDRRCLLSILGQYVLKDVLGDAYRFSKSGKYYAPTEGSLAEKLEYIAQLPAEEAPEVFGMHENANISFQLRDAKTLMDTVLSIQPRLVAAAGAKSPEDVVLDLAAELFGGLSEKPMTNEEAHESTFALGADGMLTSLAVVLSQEMERFNKLLKQMRSTLQLLQKAVKGLVVMSDDLELMFNSLLNNQVPGLWGKVAYPCLKPMASWIIDYHRRVEFFESWIANGNPKCYWLPGFFFPQGFLTGCLQAHARKYAMPIDTLNFDFSVTLMSDADEVEAGPEDGIYIDGLFVDNARWNMAEQWLDESEPGVMQSPLPVVHFLPAQKPLENLFKPEKMDEYQTPLYKTSIRAGILSTTGQSTNFVLCVLLPIREGTGPDFWVLQGAALLCMLDT
ncbi:hypothetical protein CYMTET_43439 [Cymbomonas tetramitiformis]|uniref:Dynein heavy chain n=1 Tax=Cymbomonas tetramitiformis TaxID=36881 RepID=A0AAE0C267_9CHLO|nr:hypothetical protein CYMTET_43439 [Cymbomonas tetramitiformis]